MYTDYCKEYNIDLRSDAYLILPVILKRTDKQRNKNITLVNKKIAA